MFANKKRAITLAAVGLLPLLAAGPALSSEIDNAQRVVNFLRADVNKDRQLSLNEFKTFIDLNANYKIGQAQMIRRLGLYDKIFARLDKNGNGQVTAEEFKAAAKTLKQLRQQ